MVRDTNRNLYPLSLTCILETGVVYYEFISVFTFWYRHCSQNLFSDFTVKLTTDVLRVLLLSRD